MDEALRKELLKNLEKKRDLVINSYREQIQDSNLWNFDKGRIIGLDYAIQLISELE